MKIHKFVRKHFIDIFFLIVLLVIFLGGLLAPGLSSADIGNRSKKPDSTLTQLMKSAGVNEAIEPQLSPDFILNSISGDKFQLSQQQGKVVILSFWATW